MKKVVLLIILAIAVCSGCQSNDQTVSAGEYFNEVKSFVSTIQQFRSDFKNVSRLENEDLIKSITILDEEISSFNAIVPPFYLKTIHNDGVKENEKVQKELQELKQDMEDKSISKEEIKKIYDTIFGDYEGFQDGDINLSIY